MLCLGSESKCDVCLDQFGLAEKIPTCIPCGHIFCHECFDQLPRQKCPLCQEQFNPGSKVKLYVDIEPAEVQRLHSTVLCFADNGASEAQLRDALVDFKAFLKKHPRPQFQNLRAASKMLQYILMLKSRTIELEARSDKLDYKKGSLVDRIEELKSELAGLKEENRSLEEEKRSLERDYEKAEKQNLASLRTHVDAHTFLMQKVSIISNYPSVS
ncbi:hypothetical protein DL96DRAFT_265221 [Flagelloscypha sp. PMI_526]|nr:hypothetical protein DL96DRAFT_265221 [Flagelloscypha sp. PMI_526]